MIGIGAANEVRFQYDGADRRLGATRNGVTTRYIYDANGRLLAEADASGVITRYYIYGAGLLAMALPGGNIYCYHFDATGHTVTLTDSGKTVINKYAYEPFGKISKQEEAISQPFKYVCQFGVMTEPNGLYYMRARYYDPQVGRFIPEDPAGFEGGDVNLYAYVRNNPLMFIDPFGLCTPNSFFDNWIGANAIFNFGYGQTDEEFMVARQRTRQFIEMQDIAVQGTLWSTIAFDAGGFLSTWVDIWEADVPMGNRIGAGALNWVGLLGVVGAAPIAPATAFGTFIDSMVFTEINNLLE